MNGDENKRVDEAVRDVDPLGGGSAEGDESLRAQIRLRATAENAEDDRRRPIRRRDWTFVLGALAAVGLALSPPGQAVAERVGEIVGIGEESSVTESNLRDPRLNGQQERIGPAIVTATGTMVGTDVDFEIVGWAARDKDPASHPVFGLPDSPGGTLRTCMGVVVPEQGRQETGKWCQGEDGSEIVPDPFHVFGAGGSHHAYGPNAPYEFTGVARPNVASIELTYTDGDGIPREGVTTLGMLDGELLETTGGTLPFGFFVSQIPYDGLPRDKFGFTASPAAESAVVTAYDADGNVLGSQNVGVWLKRAREDAQKPLPG